LRAETTASTLPSLFEIGDRGCAFAFPTLRNTGNIWPASGTPYIETTPGGIATFDNDGNIKFTDITGEAGLAGERYSIGATAADYDSHSQNRKLLASSNC